MPFWLPIPTNVGELGIGERLRVTVSNIKDIDSYPSVSQPTKYPVPNHSEMNLLIHSIVKDVKNKSAVITFELVNV